MEDFLLKFEQGLKGENVGLESGLPLISEAIDNIQRETNYVIFGAPKTFKTKFTDSFFILLPYLKYGTDPLDITYYSFEVNRIKKVAEWIATFFWYDYKLKYSAGHILSRSDKRVKDEHLKLVEEILKRRIIPLLGEYDSHGRKIKPGCIDFIEDKENPTGIYNYLTSKAKEHGEVITETFTTTDDKGNKIEKERVIGFKDRDPLKYRLVINDHVRLMRRERGFNLKENIDKYSEYTVFLRNIYKYSFIDLIHSNRSISDQDRVATRGGRYLRPQQDDVKDTGRRNLYFFFDIIKLCFIFVKRYYEYDRSQNLLFV